MGIDECCSEERAAQHVDVEESDSDVLSSSSAASKQEQQQQKKQERDLKTLLRYLGWWPNVTIPEACLDRPDWHRRRTHDAFHQAHP